MEDIAKAEAREADELKGKKRKSLAFAEDHTSHCDGDGDYDDFVSFQLMAVNLSLFRS